ncbi:membrane protein, partial [Campylobacter coli]
NFILIFNDKNQALNHLAFLESTLKNTELKLENETFKPEFKLVWKEKEGNLNQNLQSLRVKL